LKPGLSVSAVFNAKDSHGKSRTVKVILSVKGSDALFIGPCKYNILKIDRTETWDDRASRFVNTDYYLPELKLILAKEYREPDGKTHLNKFDRIYPLSNRPSQ